MRLQTPRPTRDHLRALARQYLEGRRGLELKPVVASGRAPDAYFECRDEDGRVFELAVRTAKNGRLAFRRKSNGWKTIDQADYVLIAAFGDGRSPHQADLYFLDSKHVIAALDEAYDAMSAAKRRAKGTFPVWISLEHVEGGHRAAGSGVIDHAIDNVTIPLDERFQRKDTQLESSHGDPSREAPLEAFPAVEISALKQAIAQRWGLPVSAVEVSVQIRI